MCVDTRRVNTAGAIQCLQISNTVFLLQSRSHTQRKAPTIFAMSVRPVGAAPNGRIFVKFSSGDFTKSA
jgi:hypothetical protein